MSASSRNTDNKGWASLLFIKDKEGVEKTWVMPMEMLAGDGLELRKKLLSLGVSLNLSNTGKTHLIQYLSERKPTHYLRAVTSLGWNRNCFVLPEKIFANVTELSDELVLENPNDYRVFQQQGSLEDWQESIGRYAAGNSLLILALSAAFCPPLLYLTGDENFGLHFVGPSSVGKTITLDVAGSVWGGGNTRGYKTRWRATVNGLEALAVKQHDTLLTLDELAEVSPRSAGVAAYMLANGTGKARGDRDGRLREPAEWRLVFLSAGEIDLVTHLESEGLRVQAGQQIRLLSIDADEGNQLGVFENIHDFASSSEFAEHLRFNALRYYGAPIRAFLSQLTALDKAQEKIQQYKADFRKNFEKTDFHGQMSRVLERFALLYAAGTLAADFNVLPIEKQELVDALGKHFHAWTKDKGSQDSIESTAILSQIRCYLQMHGLSRFPILDECHTEHVVQHCAGFRKKNKDGEYDWLILGEVFKKEVCKGLDYKSTISTLKTKGLIRLDRYGGPTIVVRVPIFGRARIYHLVSEIISCKEVLLPIAEAMLSQLSQ